MVSWRLIQSADRRLFDMKMLDIVLAKYLDKRASHLPKGDMMIPDTSSLPRPTPVLVPQGKQIYA